MHVAAVMRQCISPSLTRTFPEIGTELANILTAAELKRARESVNTFALVVTYSLLLRRIENAIGTVPTDDFFNFWAIAFKIASERADLSPDEMKTQWSSFNGMLKRYITLWHAVPSARLQRDGVQFWAQTFFADEVVECPVKPPLAVKERHARVFAAAGSVVQDLERMVEQNVGTVVVTR